MEAFQLSAPYKHLLILCLSCFLPCITPSLSAERKAAYNSLNVAARLNEIRIPPAHTNEQEEYQNQNQNHNHNEPRHPWKLQILHRNALMAGNQTYEERLIQRLKRESMRVKALNKRVRQKLNKGKETTEGEKYETEGFSGEVKSGMAEGSEQYFTRIGVGTPATEQYFVLETGSDIVWVQCEPCNDCYDQADPVDSCFSTYPLLYEHASSRVAGQLAVLPLSSSVYPNQPRHCCRNPFPSIG